MKIKFPSSFTPFAIFLIALAVRFVVICINYNNGVFESWEYESIANNILSGLGYRYDYLGTTYYAFGPPLYPFLSSLVYRFSNHSQLALVVLQTVISSTTCILIFHIGNNIFNRSIGAISSLFVAFHPGMAVYTVKLHSFNIDVFLISLTIFMFLKVVRDSSLKNFILYGIFFSLCLFSRSTIFAFLPISFLTLWIIKKKQRTKILKYSAASVLIIAFIISPWLVRNYIRVDKLIFTSVCGEQFWRGNNENASGTAYSMDKMPILLKSPPSFIARLEQLDEKGQDNLFWAEALGFIKKNPHLFIKLTLKKLYYFWWFSPTQGLNYSKYWLPIYKFYYSIILLFAILGICTGIKVVSEQKKQMLYILILFSVTISIAQALFYVDGRHRWTVEPLVLIFSASGIDFVWAKLKTLSNNHKEAV